MQHHLVGVPDIAVHGFTVGTVHGCSSNPSPSFGDTKRLSALNRLHDCNDCDHRQSGEYGEFGEFGDYGDYGEYGDDCNTAQVQ